MENNPLPHLKLIRGKLVLYCDFDLKKLFIKSLALYEECLKSFAKCFAVNNIQDLKAPRGLVLGNCPQIQSTTKQKRSISFQL